VAATPSSALGSTRDKPDEAYCQEIFKVLQAHQIEQFFYIGGNDSSDTVRIVSEQAQAANYRCAASTSPRPSTTTWSATTTRRASRRRRASWQAFAGANLDNAALPGVYVGVVMGRHAGFLTAAAGAGQEVPGRRPAPDLPARARVLARAVPGRREGHVRALRPLRDRGVGRHPRRQRRRSPPAGQVERDAHGNVQLSGTGALADLLCEEIKAKLGIKRVRGDTFGYLQRSFIGCVSDVDQREAREVGEKAVQFAMWGASDGSVAIKRTGFYSVDYELLPLSAVAGKTRVMEDEFISASGTDVTDAFRMYLRPLLGSGMPDAFRLRPAPVEKILKR
jgi:6-phosphofructokinase 1